MIMWFQRKKYSNHNYIKVMWKDLLTVVNPERLIFYFILVLWLCCFGLLSPVILSILSTSKQLFSVRSHDKPTVCCQQWVTGIQVCEDWTTRAQDKGQKQCIQKHTSLLLTTSVYKSDSSWSDHHILNHNRRCLCRSLVEYFFSSIHEMF